MLEYFCFRANFDDGWLNKIARHIKHVSANKDSATLFLGFLNSLGVGFDLCFSVQRSN